MEPKEKAQELITKFRYSREDGHEDFVAKQSAMICVDQIISLDVWDNAHYAIEGQSYWEQVKDEIFKL